MKTRTLLFTALVAVSAPALAAEAATQIGSFKQWNAYTHSDAEGKVCYVASQPQDSKYSGTIKGRDPVFFMITNKPAKNVRNEASTIIGYPFKADSKVSVDVDGQKFTMFTQADGAWMEDQAQETALIKAMKSGSKMSVTGSSRRGTESTDSYSLAGISAALDAIAKECP